MFVIVVSLHWCTGDHTHPPRGVCCEDSIRWICRQVRVKWLKGYCLPFSHSWKTHKLLHFRNSRENGYKLWYSDFWDCLTGVMIGRWYSKQPLTNHKWAFSTQMIPEIVALRACTHSPQWSLELISGVGKFSFLPGAMETTYSLSWKILRISQVYCIIFASKE